MTDGEKWTIRRALPEDAVALGECLQEAYAAHASRIDDLPDMASGCDADIAQNLVWVAEIGSRIVGGLVLIAGPDHMVLANVAIRPDSRGSGLGRAFMELAERKASALGFKEMRLNTHAAMPDNIALYRHLGWETSGQQGNTVSMRKAI